MLLDYKANYMHDYNYRYGYTFCQWAILMRILTNYSHGYRSNSLEMELNLFQVRVKIFFFREEICWLPLHYHKYNIVNTFCPPFSYSYNIRLLFLCSFD